jgi:hypothetical protein
MKSQKVISILTCIMVATGLLAAGMGIFSNAGNGPYKYSSIRGKEVLIYGKGIYRHMSAEVAPQGIAQDYVTFFFAIPFLIIGIITALRGSIKGRFLFAGVLLYMLVTYLFYLTMGMYNLLFLAYVVLLGTSFFAFVLTMRSFKINDLPASFKHTLPAGKLGGFLIFNALCIALLWLSIIVPPLINRSVIPLQVEHYTTLIVQGLDLAILLPAAFISGLLLIRKVAFGYLLASVYFVFLSFIMTALSAKVIAMATLGYNVIPVIYIIPTFNLLSIISTVVILRNIHSGKLATA